MIRRCNPVHNRRATLDMFLEELGERVRIERDREGMARAELARRVGITANAMGRIEGGSAAPNAWVLARIAEVLDCDIESLVPLTTEREVG